MRRRFDESGKNTSWALVTTETPDTAQHILDDAENSEQEAVRRLKVTRHSKQTAKASKGAMSAVRQEGDPAAHLGWGLHWRSSVAQPVLPRVQRRAGQEGTARRDSQERVPACR